MSENANPAEPRSGVILKEKIKEPRRAKVILLNDDYTTMEFVVDVVMLVFHKNQAQASEIMLKVHRQGKAVCGVYAEEIAETKVSQVYNLARAAGFPLRCTMEYV